MYEIRTFQRWKKGEQVFISYGNHGNRTLAVEYGFVLPGNSSVTLNPNLDRKFFSMEKLNFLSHNGISVEG